MKAVLVSTIILFSLVIIIDSQTTPTAEPGGRNKPGFVYDSARKRFVLFGGFGKRGEGIRGDTWEWNGTKWSEIKSTGPAPRFHHFMVYDSGRGKIVLFGGMGTKTEAAQTYGERLLGDTWEWDGRQWTKVSDSGPHKRDHHGMSYDSERGKVVLFGGSKGEFLGDVWEWDGRRWTEIKSTGPTARGGVPSMAFDAGRKAVILFGGWDAVGMQSDIWEWNGKVWKRVD